MLRLPVDSPSAEKSGSIGLLLEQHNVTRSIFVKSLMPGGPAHRDGRLRQGDRLISVDGNGIAGLDLTVVFEMIKGVPGTKVRLHFIYKSVSYLHLCSVIFL
jgi:C-terminal processing protease CtpA/Prc